MGLNDVIEIQSNKENIQNSNALYSISLLSGLIFLSTEMLIFWVYTISTSFKTNDIKEPFGCYKITHLSFTHLKIPINDLSS